MAPEHAALATARGTQMVTKRVIVPPATAQAALAGGWER
jgi:hypothetical protein